MSIKNILLVVENAPAGSIRLDAAVAFADQQNAHLVVLGIEPLPQIDLGYDGGIGGSFVVEEMQRAQERAAELGRKLSAQLGTSGISSEVRSAARSYPGIAVEIARHGRYADLILIGRSAEEGNARSFLENAADGALFDSGRAVVQLPPDWSESFGKNIIIAWDGSRAATRAVAAAMPLIETADSVIIAIAAPEAGTDRHGEEPGADLGTALSRHNSNVSVDRLPVFGKSISETLLGHATDLGADLIVHGAYGHSRIAEAIFGGVTRDIIRTANVPLLMAH
jgi:nucleotide-binding universal stress UspA family protein